MYKLNRIFTGRFLNNLLSKVIKKLNYLYKTPSPLVRKEQNISRRITSINVLITPDYVMNSKDATEL